MRFFTAAKILFASTLALAPLLHTAAAQSTSEPISIVAQSRVETSTRVVVTYNSDGRRLTMIGDRSNPSVTHVDVVEGSRYRLRGAFHRDGSATLTNHLGRTFTASQLKANTALFDQFDRDALVVLEPHVSLYLTTGDGGTQAAGGAAGLCLLGPWAAGACLVGAGIGAFIVACDPWLDCSGDGCTGGFNCGE